MKKWLRMKLLGPGPFQQIRESRSKTIFDNHFFGYHSSNRTITIENANLCFDFAVTTIPCSSSNSIPLGEFQISNRNGTASHGCVADCRIRIISNTTKTTITIQLIEDVMIFLFTIFLFRLFRI